MILQWHNTYKNAMKIIWNMKVFSLVITKVISVMITKDCGLEISFKAGVNC